MQNNPLEATRLRRMSVRQLCVGSNDEAVLRHQLFHTFLWSEGSVWRRLTTKFAKITIGVMVTLPALFATWWLGSFLLGFLSSYLHRGT